MKRLKTIIDTKKWLAILIVTTIYFLHVPQGLAVPVDPTALVISNDNTINWNYSSPLNVIETITNLGGGSYQYEYSFINVDTSPIWNIGIYTTFGGTANVTNFTGYPTWGSATDAITDVLPEYDARNLDPSILEVPHTWTMPWEDPVTSIQVGASVSGFSFTAPTYDASPKYYSYETLASGYTQTNGTGNVAAVGQTIPEPTTIALLGLGALSLIRRKRRA
jgi:hypothetical protein